MKVAKRFSCLLAVLVLLCGLCLPAPARASSLDDDIEELTDGTYTVEVKLEGGSGRASITSPTLLVLKDGTATATIEWSSPNYDYMIVDGKKYLPTNKNGNSKFEIPVEYFNQPLEVTADTTAMSTPHEIAYQLTFDAFSLHKKSRIGDFITYVLPIVLVVVIAATAYHVRRHP